MHKNYEHLVGLHQGLWERQARWMLEVGGAEGFGSKAQGLKWMLWRISIVCVGELRQTM